MGGLGVLVAVVEVGQVRVSVRRRFVRVTVLVAADDGNLVHVVVVSVGVVVLVVVVGRHVRVRVLVVAAQNEGHARYGHQHREHLLPEYRLGEYSPGHDCPDERGCCEHQLTASGADVARTRNPQRDRRAITDRTDSERRQHSPTRRPSIERQADDEVDAARNNALGQRDVHGRQLVQFRCHIVVDCPAETCACDKQCASSKLSTAGPRQPRTGNDDKT